MLSAPRCCISILSVLAACLSPLFSCTLSFKIVSIVDEYSDHCIVFNQPAVFELVFIGSLVQVCIPAETLDGNLVTVCTFKSMLCNSAHNSIIPLNNQCQRSKPSTLRFKAKLILLIFRRLLTSFLSSQSSLLYSYLSLGYISLFQWLWLYGSHTLCQNLIPPVIIT